MIQFFFAMPSQYVRREGACPAYSGGCYHTHVPILIVHAIVFHLSTLTHLSYYRVRRSSPVPLVPPRFRKGNNRQIPRFVIWGRKWDDPDKCGDALTLPFISYWIAGAPCNVHARVFRIYIALIENTDHEEIAWKGMSDVVGGRRPVRCHWDVQRHTPSRTQIRDDRAECDNE